MILLLLALGGCGGDTKTVVERTVVKTAPAETVTGPTETNGDSGQVRGPLMATGIGPVSVGMSTNQVERLFGAPDKETVAQPGGELPVLDSIALIWTYKLSGGPLILYFDKNSRRLNSYGSRTPELATRSGVAVGDSFAPMYDQYRKQLTKLVGGYLLSRGSPGSYPALLFYTERGPNSPVIDIRGGRAPLVVD